MLCCGSFIGIICSPTIRFKYISSITLYLYDLWKKCNLDLFQKSLRNRRKALILIPDQVHFHFQVRGKRSEDHAAVFRRINKVAQRQKDPKAFFRKHRTIIGKLERTFQMQLRKLLLRPGTDIMFPALLGCKQRQIDKIVGFDLFLLRQV